MIKFLVVAAICILSFAANAADVIFLDYYDQLVNYIGTSNMIYVRDAGATRTGQHGDPMVDRGGAYYVFDARYQKFTLVATQQSIDMARSMNPSNFISVAAYQADNAVLRNKLAAYEAAYIRNVTVISNLIASIDDIHAAFDIETMTRLRRENERFKGAFERMTNITVSTNSKFSELKEAVVEELKAADYALGGEGTYELK